MSKDIEIRFVGDMHRLEVKPGDKFVLQCEQDISQEMAERIRHYVRDFLGEDVRVLVLSSGLKLGVVSGDRVE